MTLSQQMIALRALILREIRRFSRIWVQTILPPVVTTTLYYIIFGEFIGSQLAHIDGYRYIDYIVPGLILMSAITNSYANVVSSFYSSKFQRNIEEMLVSSMPNHIILTGFIVGGIVRGTIVGIVVFLVSLIFTNLTVNNFFWMFGILFLTTVLFSLAGLINGIYARSFDDISIIPTFVLAPLTYLGGIFYSIHMLPDFWQTISLFNPILYMINSFRYSMLGVSDISFALSIVIIIGFIIVLFAVCLYLLNKGIRIKY